MVLMKTKLTPKPILKTARLSPSINKTSYLVYDKHYSWQVLNSRSINPCTTILARYSYHPHFMYKDTETQSNTII